jgi:hypothetical protein
MLSIHATTFADFTAQTQLVLPKTELEYKNLSSPIDAYSDEFVTAIVESNPTTQSVCVFYNNQYTTLTGTFNSSDVLNDFTALKQVKKFGNSLLITNQALISEITLSDEIKATEITDTSGNSIRGNYFDANDDYLAIAYSTQAFIYSYEDNAFTMQSTLTISNVKGDAPITINDNGEIFYVSGQGYIYKTSVSNIKTQQNLIQVSPDAMIADNDFLYYIYNNIIYRLSITEEDAQPQMLTVIENAKYDLGNLSNPVNLSFKGENL